MAEPKADPYSTEPIHFSEAYRRARRNVLFWAVTTIVVALGAHGNDTIEVTGLVNGLAFQPWLLLLGLLAILGFMLAGYVRAEQDLTYLNSEQVVSQRTKEAIDIVESIKAKLLELRGEAQQQEYRLKNLYDGIDEARSQFDRRLDGAFEEYIAQTEGRVRRELQSGSLNPEETQKAAIECVRSLTKDTKELLAKWQRLHFEFANERPQAPTSETADEAFGEVIAPFQNLADRLTGLSNSISIRQKHWFFWQDRVPVWASCMAALAFALLRLAASDDLDTWLDIADVEVVAVEESDSGYVDRSSLVADGEQGTLSDAVEAP